MNRNKEYLGDGVYVEISPYGEVILTTENGYETTNTIALEDSVWSNLQMFIKRYTKRIAEEETHEH